MEVEKNLINFFTIYATSFTNFHRFIDLSIEQFLPGARRTRTCSETYKNTAVFKGKLVIMLL